MQWTEQEHRRECFIRGGWNLTDDDTPRPPELSPLASAQSRRAWREEARPQPEAIG